MFYKTETNVRYTVCTDGEGELIHEDQPCVLWNKLLTSKDLIEEDLDVVGGERLRRHNHFVQVALHQFCYHVAGERFAVKENHTQTDLRLHRHDASPSTELNFSCRAGHCCLTNVCKMYCLKVIIVIDLHLTRAQVAKLGE